MNEINFLHKAKSQPSMLRKLLSCIASIHPNPSHTLLRDLSQIGVSGKRQDLVDAHTYPRRHLSDPQAEPRRLNIRGRKEFPRS